MGPGAAGFVVASGNGSSTFQYSFKPFSDQVVAAAMHDVELPYPDDDDGSGSGSGGGGGGGGAGLDLHVDAETLGLGGDDSWSPRVHAEYVVDKHRTFRR